MIGFGCVDSASDNVESVAEIKKRIEKGIEIFDPRIMLLDPDCGMRMRSHDVAYRKLKKSGRCRKGNYGWHCNFQDRKKEKITACVEDPEFSTNCKAPVFGGDSAYPNRPFALRLCRITFSGIIAPGGCHSGGGGGITCRSP